MAVVTGTGQGITVNSVGPAAIKTPKMNPLKLEKWKKQQQADQVGFRKKQKMKWVLGLKVNFIILYINMEVEKKEYHSVLFYLEQIKNYLQEQLQN